MRIKWNNMHVLGSRSGQQIQYISVPSIPCERLWCLECRGGHYAFKVAWLKSFGQGHALWGFGGSPRASPWGRASRLMEFLHRRNNGPVCTLNLSWTLQKWCEKYFLNCTAQVWFNFCPYVNLVIWKKMHFIFNYIRAKGILLSVSGWGKHYSF